MWKNDRRGLCRAKEEERKSKQKIATSADRPKEPENS